MRVFLSECQYIVERDSTVALRFIHSIILNLHLNMARRKLTLAACKRHKLRLADSRVSTSVIGVRPKERLSV